LGYSEAAGQELATEFAPLREGIEAVRRRLVWRRVVRSALLMAAGLSLIVAAAVLITRIGPPAWPLRAGLLVGAGAIIATGLAGAVLPLLRQPSLGAAAAHVERAFPELDDRLLSAVELAAARQPDIYSGALVRALMRDARAAVEPLAIHAAVDLAGVRCAAHSFAVSGCLCAVLVALFPQSLQAFFAAPSRSASVPPAPPAWVSPRRPTVEAPAAPRIADVAIKLTPPSYSGLPTRIISDMPRSLAALVGTQVTVSGRLSGSARLEVAGESASVKSIPMAAGAKDASEARFTLLRDVTCRLLVEGEGPPAMSLHIQALADAPPVVRIDEPGKDMSLEEPAPIPLVVSAADDFGLGHVALQYRVNDASDWHSRELASPGTTTVRLERTLDLSPMHLVPGDAVAYRAVATDNDAVSGPKRAVSRTYVMRLAHLPMAKAGAQLAEAEQAQAKTLDELRDEVQQLGEELDRLTRDLEKPRATSEGQTGRLQNAMQRVEALTHQLDQAIANTMQQMAVNELITPEMMEKVGQLQQLLRETLDEGLRASLDRIQEALGNVDRDAIRQQLLQARDMQQEFLQRLDQTIELLKSVYREQRLGQAVQMAERLVQREAELKQRTEAMAAEAPEQRGAAEERELQKQAEEQDAIARDAADLRELLAELADELAEAEPEAAEQIGRLSDTAGAQRDMEEASQRLREQRPDRAVPPEARALSALRRLVAGLKQRQAAALGDARGGLPARLQQMARDALYLSQQQEQLMEGTEPLSSRLARQLLGGKQELERLAREQEAVADGARELARGLRGLSKETSVVDPSLAERAEAGAERAAQAVREIRGAAPARALSQQREAMRVLNESAAELLRLAQKAAGASQRMALEQYLKQLEAMAQGQQALNEQTAQQLGQTGLPLVPGGGTLQQLAAEQELIRGALEKMLGQAERDGQGQFGDQLGDVPGQMEDVEEDLRQVRAGRETLQTQGDILRKMLDAQRSLHTKEHRPERKAVQAKPYEIPKSPPKLQPPKSARAESAEPMMPPEALPLDFEELVRDYFRWLRQEQHAQPRESR